MKVTKKELRKIIQEELSRVDEIFNIPFGKPPKSRRSRPTERGLSKEMEYDDFLTGLDRKGQDVFDSAASYSDMKDAKQDKAFDKMDANSRDMTLDLQDMVSDRINQLEQSIEKTQQMMNQMYQKIMNDIAKFYPNPRQGGTRPTSGGTIAEKKDRSRKPNK